MSLYETMKADMLSARKTKDTETKNVLSVLLGTFETEAKNGTEITTEHIVRTVKKLIKANIETGNVEENKLIQKYVPVAILDSELKSMCENAVIGFVGVNGNVSMRNMGEILKDLNAHYPGKIDNKAASGFLKTFILQK